MRYLIIFTLTFLISGAVGAKAPQLEQEFQVFSVKTGVSRVIYTPGSAGASVLVMNPQNYPMLVQSVVLKADKNEKAPFIVTPPLFRLDGNQRNRIKVIATDDTGLVDRESLNWLCITGIPPEPDSIWAQNNMKIPAKRALLLTQMRVKSCIKLLVRPIDLKGNSVSMAASLSWHKSGATLTVDNPSPFYMNLKTVRLGKTSIDSPGFVPPKGQLKITIPASESGPVQWVLITDVGGKSREFVSALN